MTKDQALSSLQKMIDRVLDDVLGAKMPVILGCDNTVGYFVQVPGFYKHGTVKLFYDDGADRIRIEGRYGPLDYDLEQPLDLAQANFSEWMKYRNSKSNFDGDLYYMDDLWLPILLKYKLVKEEVHTRIVPNV